MPDNGGKQRDASLLVDASGQRRRSIRYANEVRIADCGMGINGASVLSLNYVEITAALASASLARLIFARTSRPEARQTYFFGSRLRSTR